MLYQLSYAARVINDRWKALLVWKYIHHTFYMDSWRACLYPENTHCAWSVSWCGESTPQEQARGLLALPSGQWDLGRFSRWLGGWRPALTLRAALSGISPVLPYRGRRSGLKIASDPICCLWPCYCAKIQQGSLPWVTTRTSVQIHTPLRSQASSSSQCAGFDWKLKQLSEPGSFNTSGLSKELKCVLEVHSVHRLNS